MQILIVEPEQTPIIAEITGDLKEMQRIVGGYIQAVYPFEEPIALVCNEEGMLNGLQANSGLWDENGNLYDIICGTFFLCGAPSDCDHFTSLMPEQIKKFEKRFHSPEMFVRIDDKVVCLPLENNAE